MVANGPNYFSPLFVSSVLSVHFLVFLCNPSHNSSFPVFPFVP